MKYFALYDDNNNLITFGTTTARNVAGEITLEEYEILKDAHTTKYNYAQLVFDGTIVLDEVPEEYRESVAAIVDQMQIQPEEPMSDIDEAIAILSGEVIE